MKVYHDFPRPGEILAPIATIGSYDGVHRGHREIITLLRQKAQECRGQSVVITFDPHPRHLLQPDYHELRLLNTLAEKLELLEQAGVAHVIVAPFTHALSRLSAEEFVRQCLIEQLGIDTLIVGFNHHLGRDQKGTPDALNRMGAALGFGVVEMPRQEVEGSRVSSTAIRKLVGEGKMTSAGHLLSGPYPLRGRLEGQKITGIDPLKLLPPMGDYHITLKDGAFAIKTRLKIDSKQALTLPDVRPELFGMEDLKEIKLTFE